VDGGIRNEILEEKKLKMKKRGTMAKVGQKGSQSSEAELDLNQKITHPQNWDMHD